MDTTPHPKLRVAICGAGVGGLLLAVILARSPHITVDVYEAAAELKEVGAGIGMWPRTWKIMKKLGLDTLLGKKAIVPAEGIPKVAFNFRRGDIPQGHTFETLVTPGGLISFHRPDFQSVLLDTLAASGRCRTWTGKRVVSYAEHPGPSSSARPTPVEIHFADGSTATTDLLVGADGVRSAVRGTMVRQAVAELRERALATDDAALLAEADSLLQTADARWSGTFAYRATIPAEEVQRRWSGHRVLTTPHVYLGKNTQMTVYPMARGTLINFAAFRARYELEGSVLGIGADFTGGKSCSLLPKSGGGGTAAMPPPDSVLLQGSNGTVPPMVQSVSKEEFGRDFEGWEEEAGALVDCLHTTSRWAVHTVGPLKSFISTAGNVVLLGDAAHAMMPYQGSGAGQAIEDAYILGTLLTHPSTIASFSPTHHPNGTNGTGLHVLTRIARVYDAVRRPVAQDVAAASRDAGLLYTLNYPGLSFPERPAHSHTPFRSPPHAGMGPGDEEKLQEVFARIRMNWEWAWDTSVEGDVERAVGMLVRGEVVSVAVDID